VTLLRFTEDVKTMVEKELMEKSFLFTEEDGVSTLKKLSETKEVVIPFQYQLIHPTAKSLN